MTLCLEGLPLTDHPQLTRRELQVLRRLQHGLSNREIGAELGITEDTVKVYVHGLCRKYGVHSRTLLVTQTKYHGLDLTTEGASNLHTRAFVLGTTGIIRELPHREPTLEELQTAVGGYIEVLQITFDGRDGHLIFDEEGKLKGKVFNSAATMLARTAGIALDDFVVGDAVVLTGEAMLT